MSERVTCIGGPLDGKRVEWQGERYRVPEREPTSLAEYVPSRPVAATFQVTYAVYRSFVFRIGSRKFELYADERLDDDAVMAILADKFAAVL